MQEIVVYYATRIENYPKLLYSLSEKHTAEWMLHINSHKPTNFISTDRRIITYKTPRDFYADFRYICEDVAIHGGGYSPDANYRDEYAAIARKLFIIEEEQEKERLCIDRDTTEYLGAYWEEFRKTLGLSPC